MNYQLDDMSNIHYHTQTFHSTLFRDTYWGSFRGKCNESIRENRNRFVQMFGLKKISKPPQWVHKHCEISEKNRSQHSVLDHIEHYITETGRFIVSSPYHHGVNEEWYMVNGWHKTIPIYNPNADTYVKVLPRTKNG